MEVYNSKTRVLEGSSMAVGGEVAGLWPPSKTTIWSAKVRFYQGFSYFSESDVGASPSGTDFVSSKRR